jgi:nucleoside-diphosphate-sugar epimerase
MQPKGEIMRCLVTGNHGYIGYIMVHDLLKSGHEVVGYDCNYFPEEVFGRGDTFESSKGIRQITKDIRDISDADFKGIDAVIHLAGLVDDPDGRIWPDIQMDINYLSTLELAIKARRNGVKRFIFASSTSVYGIKGDELLDEESSAEPVTWYAKSKLYSEYALSKMISEDFAVTCMRNATCFGISPRMRVNMVLNCLAGFAYTEGKVNVVGDGMNWRPVVHIEDVARAYIDVLAADPSKVSGQVFGVGCGSYRINELAEAVKEALPNSVIVHGDRGNDNRSYRVSFEKMEKVLGFKTKYSIRDGIKELIKGYEEFGLTKEKFQEDRFWSTKYYKSLTDSGKVDRNLRIKTG